MLKRLYRWLAVHFTRHELWALRMAMRFPPLGLFVIFSLVLVWLILPVVIGGGSAILISKIAVPLLTGSSNTEMSEGASTALMLIALPLGCTAMFFIFAWFFRWYLIAATLMFGRRHSAQEMQDHLEQRLQRYTHPPA